MTLSIHAPQDLGLDAERFFLACQLAESLAAQDRIPGLAFQLIRPQFGGATAVFSYGRRRLDGSALLDGDDLFLVASLTKPIVAMGVLRLIESGRLGLNDRVRDLIPEFQDAAKRSITVRHLLTHTSGLPDMLPENRELRQQQSSLTTFIEGTCRAELNYIPGRGTQYQSMGYALLGEIVARVSGLTCANFLQQEFFDPLGMTSTSLGLPPMWLDDPQSPYSRLVEIRVPDDQLEGVDWNWNSRYWQTLGAPWGGLLSTVEDLGRFSQMMLQLGSVNGRMFLNPATIRAAIGNRLDAYRDLPEGDRRCRSWGYGWRQNWTAHGSPFVELGDEASIYGHWGATGTLWWLAPQWDAALVLLSSQPLPRESSDLLRVSNAIAASIR